MGSILETKDEFKEMIKDFNKQSTSIHIAVIPICTCSTYICMRGLKPCINNMIL